jgi:hypothetical protein
MALTFNSVYVDEKYSPIVDKVLGYKNPLIPGVTCTEVFQTGQAGQIFVHKPGSTTIAPALPGQDFSAANVADTLITITFNQQFNRDRKIYGVQSANVAFDKVATELEAAVTEVKDGVISTALAFARNGGTIIQSGGSNDTTALTKDNIQAYLLAARKAIVDAKGNPDTLFVNTTVYALLLGINEFAPEFNQERLANGIVGRIYGMNVLELNAFTGTITPAGGSETSLATISFIALDHTAFHVLPNLNTVRVKDAEGFVGVRCQVEMLYAFKVSNALFAQVKVSG